MPMEENKGEIRNRVGIMLGLVDRSDEGVGGTTERVVKARTDARYAKSIRSVPWQPNPAEAAEGEPVGLGPNSHCQCSDGCSREQTGSAEEQMEEVERRP